MKGEHVMHHFPGLWNGIWSDMYIETTFMRYGHEKSGIIGVTLKPETMEVWCLSSKLEQDLVCLIEPDDNGKQDKHKEESNGRIDSDKVDRNSIRRELQECISPMSPNDNVPGTRWIETPLGESCKNASALCLLMTICLKWLILFLEK